MVRRPEFVSFKRPTKASFRSGGEPLINDFREALGVFDSFAPVNITEPRVPVTMPQVTSNMNKATRPSSLSELIFGCCG
jgi:hypothetical protein